MEERVLAVRDEHPAWGGRKIGRRLQDLGDHRVPSPSTVTAVLHRNGRIQMAASAGHKPFERFERAAPNELWQMDYKGHFATGAGRCHPLTVVDDHSRYALGLRACGDEREGTVQSELTAIFRRYGLPDRMLTDNGAPWGSAAVHRYTWLTVWLLELGVAVSHGRPYHPQTQGKDERFHRTLTAEVIGRRAFADLAECQQQFDYGPAAVVRRVDGDGWLSFGNRPVKLGRAFSHRRVALRATDQDGCFDVMFCAHRVGALDLRAAAP
jgi:transposase InsO family protein